MKLQLERWRALRHMDEWLRTPMLVLSLIWLALVVVDLTVGTSPLLGVFATVIWVIFIIEFVVRLLVAPDKRRFLKHNWLTLLALIVPALRLFRALAILRAARGLRLIRIVSSANRSMRALQGTLRRRQFGYVTLMTLLVMALGSAGMLNLEPASEIKGGFTSYWDALWWTGMLLTTIGSQFWPATQEGRVLAFLLSLYGLAVLGYLTATFASFFIGRDAEDETGRVAGAAELQALKDEVAALRRAIERTNPALIPPA